MRGQGRGTKLPVLFVPLNAYLTALIVHFQIRGTLFHACSIPRNIVQHLSANSHL